MNESTKQGITKKIVLHFIAWVLFIVIPVFLLDDFERLSRYAPLHYYLSAVLLVPIYYSSNHFIQQKKISRYLLLMALFLVFYHGLPVLVCKLLPENKLAIDFYSLEPWKQAKLRMGTLTLFLIVWAASIISHIYDLRQRAIKLQEQNAKAELSLLKSQINPHFLFNSLNSIYYLSLKKEDAAPKAVITLSDLMRYVLTEAIDEFVLLEQEINYINKYLELQKLRLPQKTSLHCDFDVQDTQIEIAPLLLIPFIENAFKYGISANTETKISIRLISRNKHLDLTVTNKIFETEGENIGTETGLKNVQKRLSLIYPNKHSLQIESDKQNFEIKLNLILS